MVTIWITGVNKIIMSIIIIIVNIFLSFYVQQLELSK